MVRLKLNILVCVKVKEHGINEDHLWSIEFELKRSITNKWDECFSFQKVYV